jgi:glycosyl transferase family 87
MSAAAVAAPRDLTIRRDTLLALALLVAGFAATLWLSPFDDDTVNDLFVYQQFTVPVLDGQLPYREVFFEYPPLAAPAIALPGVVGTDLDTLRWAFAGWTLLLAAVAMLLCAALAARTGGDRRAALFAMAATPFLLGALVRTHFDLAPVALLLATLLLLCVGRPRLGLGVLGLAVMTKGFPLVAAPVAIAWLVGRGERRAALEGAAVLMATIAVLAAAAVAASPHGAVDAVEYHTDRPIQIESAPAVVLRALDGLGLGEVESVSSHRSDALLHRADGAVEAAFGVALLAVLALLAASVLPGRRGDAIAPGGGSAARAGGGDARRLVLASLAAVLAFAALGKVLSPQYLIWIAPLGALALAWRRYALAATVLVACVLTQLEFPARYFDLIDRDPLPVAIVTLRDLTLLVALGLCLRELLSSREAAAARST